MNLRRQRIGVDLDSRNQVRLLMAYFNSRLVGPTQVFRTGRGYHIKIGVTLPCVSRNGVRAWLGDDSVAGNQKMFYRRNGKLVFGDVESAYNSFQEGNTIEVITVVGKWKETLNKPDRKYGLTPSIYHTEVVFLPISAASCKGEKPVFRVTLVGGRNIEITENHSLMISHGHEIGFISKPLAEIKPNERIVGVDVVPSRGDNINEELDFLTFLGLWMGDGFYMKHRNGVHGVGIATGKDTKTVEWLRLFSQKIGLNLTKKDDKGDYAIYGVTFARKIRNWMGDVDSHTKQVPKVLFTATENEISAFLKGYFTADGCFTHTAKGREWVIAASSVSDELMYGVSVLLTRLGIKHNVHMNLMKRDFSGKPRTGPPAPIWTITITRVIYVKKFLQEIGFLKYTPSLISQSGTQKVYSDVATRKIKKIEFVGTKVVYDFEIPTTHTFVVNGVLCHNSEILWWDALRHELGLHGWEDTQFRFKQYRGGRWTQEEPEEPLREPMWVSRAPAKRPQPLRVSPC